MELTRAKIITELRRRGAGPAKARLYADIFMTYHEAQANIDDCGAIVQHPRTANPIENPYLKIRDSAARMLRSFKGVNADALWTQLNMSYRTQHPQKTPGK